MDQLMTLAEVAEFLQLSEKTVLKMVKNSEIPCAKMANQWRFSRMMLEDWITSKMEVIPQNDLSRLIEAEYDFVPLSRLIKEENIILEMNAADKNGALAELAENAFRSNLVSNKSEFLKKLKEREQIVSTAIGKGIAIPHIRKPSDRIINEPRIVIGLSSAGIDFSSLDGMPTHVFFLLITDSETVHLRVLAKLTDVLRHESNIDELRKCKTREDFLNFFIKMEQEMFHKVKVKN